LGGEGYGNFVTITIFGGARNGKDLTVTIFYLVTMGMSKQLL
jgi:hypothetical protein